MTEIKVPLMQVVIGPFGKLTLEPVSVVQMVEPDD